MELTREQAIAEHRKMWRWLAEHPEKLKINYIHKLKRERIATKGMINHCFLCTYTDYHCTRCPLDWGSKCCADKDDLLDKWYRAKSFEEKAKIAKQIAELPEREVKDE